MAVRKYLIRQPLGTIALATAAHSILYGVAFLFAWHDARITTLYSTMDMPWLFGLVMLLAGLVTAAGLLTNRLTPFRIASDIQGFGWIFVFLLYGITGHWFYGFGMALFWAGASGYTAFFLDHPAEQAVLASEPVTKGAGTQTGGE